MTGRQLKALRTKWGISQRRLASLLDMHENTVYKWEAASEDALDRVYVLAIERIGQLRALRSDGD